MDTLLKQLLQTAYKPGAYDRDENVALACFFAISSLLENAANDTRNIISDFFTVLYEALENSLLLQNFQDQEMQYNYQSYIASAIESALTAERIKLNKEQTKAILSKLIATFKQRENVYEEGLLACSAIALCKNYIVIKSYRTSV